MAKREWEACTSKPQFNHAGKQRRKAGSARQDMSAALT